MEGKREGKNMITSGIGREREVERKRGRMGRERKRNLYTREKERWRDAH